MLLWSQNRTRSRQFNSSEFGPHSGRAISNQNLAEAGLADSKSRSPYLAALPGLAVRKGLVLGPEFTDTGLELPRVKASSQLGQLTGDSKVVRIQRP